MAELMAPKILDGCAANKALRAHDAPHGDVGATDVVMVLDHQALCWWRVLAPEAELLWLHVLDGSQGQGLGSLLLAASMEHLHHRLGVTELFLEVSVKNNTAYHLYHKFGFKVVGTRKKYYQDKDTGNTCDAYVMTCNQFHR